MQHKSCVICVFIVIQRGFAVFAIDGIQVQLYKRIAIDILVALLEDIYSICVVALSGTIRFGIPVGKFSFIWMIVNIHSVYIQYQPLTRSIGIRSVQNGSFCADGIPVAVDHILILVL